MTPAIPTPAFRPHVLTVLESRHSMLRRCASRALAADRFDAAVMWNYQALELEAVIGMVQQVMKGAAQ